MAAYADDVVGAGVLRRHVKASVLGARAAGDDAVLRHVVLCDHLTRSVVVTIRGTADAHDVVADASAADVDFLGATAHEGMLRSARLVLDRVRAAVLAALRENPGYELVFAGHSMGAGAAILAVLTVLSEWRDVLAAGGHDATCFAFAPPPVLSSPHVPGAERVLAFARDTDVVPRTSLRGLAEVMGVWTAIDRVDAFDIKARLSALASSELPERVALAVDRALAADAEDDAADGAALPRGVAQLVRGRTRMYVPGRVVWLLPRGSPPSPSPSPSSDGLAPSFAAESADASGPRTRTSTGFRELLMRAPSRTVWGLPVSPASKLRVEFDALWLTSEQFAEWSRLMFVGASLGFADHAGSRYKDALEALAADST